MTSSCGPWSLLYLPAFPIPGSIQARVAMETVMNGLSRLEDGALAWGISGVAPVVLHWKADVV